MTTVTFQVPDEVYEACRQRAARYQTSVEECVLDFLLQHRPKPRPQTIPEGPRAARERLRRHAGAQSLGYPTGADNESIDADLAREYGATHEAPA